MAYIFIISYKHTLTAVALQLQFFKLWKNNDQHNGMWRLNHIFFESVTLEGFVFSFFFTHTWFFIFRKNLFQNPFHDSKVRFKLKTHSKIKKKTLWNCKHKCYAHKIYSCESHKYTYKKLSVVRNYNVLNNRVSVELWRKFFNVIYECIYMF